MTPDQVSQLRPYDHWIIVNDQELGLFIQAEDNQVVLKIRDSYKRFPLSQCHTELTITNNSQVAIEDQGPRLVGRIRDARRTDRHLELLFVPLGRGNPRWISLSKIVAKGAISIHGAQCHLNGTKANPKSIKIVIDSTLQKLVNSYQQRTQPPDKPARITLHPGWSSGGSTR